MGTVQRDETTHLYSAVHILTIWNPNTYLEALRNYEGGPTDYRPNQQDLGANWGGIIYYTGLGQT